MEGQTMRYLLACLTLSLFVFAYGHANAQGNMYVGVAGGYALDAFDQDPIWSGIGADPDELQGTFAGHVFLGYMMNENLTFEGDFGYYFGWNPDESALEDYELTLMAGTVSAKYVFATDSEWRPYAIGGVGWGKFETEAPSGATFTIPDEDGALDTEQSGLLARVGGGIEYDISDTMMLCADVTYVLTFGDIEDWNFIDLRVGVAMTFE